VKSGSAVVADCPPGTVPVVEEVPFDVAAGVVGSPVVLMIEFAISPSSLEESALPIEELDSADSTAEVSELCETPLLEAIELRLAPFDKAVWMAVALIPSVDARAVNSGLLVLWLLADAKSLPLEALTPLMLIDTWSSSGRPPPFGRSSMSLELPSARRRAAQSHNGRSGGFR